MIKDTKYDEVYFLNEHTRQNSVCECNANNNNNDDDDNIVVHNMSLTIYIRLMYDAIFCCFEVSS